MFSSLWVMILSIASGVVKFAGNMMEYFKTQQNIQIGKQLQDAEIKAKEAEIALKQAEILAQPKTKEELEKQLNDGKF